ncbi:MAG: uroporphyrinogen-III C-methyltransferase [Candidatus Omnitrophica bacterium]|nr:uroporphyrinogen-III C-methyltransferase [Candidatus Omnitrophota bacterium]MBU2043628.1 uroporphyrinogen-III C-methyltransferase [Candidatus Omnitrophota bacterium]MBU2251006.1 uroporphyrinogen-III C-methyltransferase [Candidatus Omnitrophota bacterium]MBU2265618.1 uroporphyrinogen-III C-methyltransferase [Candidatus Omnitrophota bacterium]
MSVNNGKVYIVGAGPGDPELISLKGYRILKTADCLLYDFLSAPELLKEVKPSCAKVCVGKKDGLHLKEQKEINRLLYEKSLKYKKVVRLKGGDPFIFSRGIDEARYLSRKKVDYEIIPGITSGLAAPESVGIPLTIKNRISSVAILTGRKKNIDAPIDAPACQTLIYLMAVANIRNVVKALKRSGRRDDTPCAFIEQATTKNSRMVQATVATIEERSRKAKVKPPAVLIVGEVVKQRVGSK